MPITIKYGSIFDSSAQVLVCPVNCVGVMGKGLALEFKQRFPEMWTYYKTRCDAGELEPGSVYFNRNIALFTTKNHWRDASQIEWIEYGLIELADCRYSVGFQSIAIPQLGCGCGGLDWAEVWPLYEKHLGGLDCDVEVWIHEG